MWAVERLKICTLMGSSCPKHIKFRWKSAEVLCLMTLKSDAEFEEEQTFFKKNDIRNLANFGQTLQSSKICTLLGSFWPEYII